MTAAGLIACGVAPWLATLTGATLVLLAIAFAVSCLLPLALLRRAGACRTTDGPMAASDMPV